MDSLSPVSVRHGPVRTFTNTLLRDLLCVTPYSFLKRNMPTRRGTIIRVERVRPDDRPDFAPNSHRETRPEFLDALITRAKKTGYDIVSIAEASDRLAGKITGNKFICLTFDGAYKEHFPHLLPVLREHDVPYALFAATQWQEGEGHLWWYFLEELIAKQDAVMFDFAGESAYFDCKTIGQKYRAFNYMENHVLSLSPSQRLELCRELSEHYGMDMKAICSELMMSWGELRRIAVSQNATIGSLGLNHQVLDDATASTLEADIRESQTILEAQIGQRPAQFAYNDYGTTKVPVEIAKIVQGQGLQSAFTHHYGRKRRAKGLDIFAVPRVSATGRAQRRRYLDMLLSASLRQLF